MELFRQIDPKTYKHEMPKYPVLVLTTHVAIKGLELGSVCGYLAFALSKSINFSDLGPWAKYTSRGPFIGCALALASLGSKAYITKTLDVAGVDER